MSTFNQMSNSFIIALSFVIKENGSLAETGNANGVLFHNHQPCLGIAEERLSRKKYDGGIKNLLRVFSEYIAQHDGKLEALCISSFGLPLKLTEAQEKALKKAVLENSPWDALPPVYFVDSHHEAHALTGLSQSGKEASLVIVIDHTGSVLDDSKDPNHTNSSVEQTSFYYWNGSTINLIDRQHDEPGAVGFGRLFSKVTRYCGFKSYNESGKLMGLASFGDGGSFKNCRLVDNGPDRSFRTSLTHAQYADDGLEDLVVWFKEHGYPLPPKRREGEILGRIQMDIAAWLHQQMSEALCAKIAALGQDFDFNSICMTGGVALNSVVNSYIAQEFREKQVYIPPSPSDAGIALGAALKYLLQKTGTMPFIEPQVYFGPEYTESDYHTALDLVKDLEKYEIHRAIDPVVEGARLLEKKKIIGWFQGRSEFGPRSLGSRSILSSPENNWTKEILNAQLKLREWFRPYAPSICLDDFESVFEDSNPSPYMMQVATVRKSYRSLLSACIHVDGTSRHHTVTEQSNPVFYRLIKAFKDRTGIPAVLNTSFNLNDMPIVETPVDAVKCFILAEGMDALILGSVLITKKRNY